MERKEKRQGGFWRALGAFALGATAGTIVALLYAPASGRTTRKRIRLQVKALQRRAVTLRDAAGKQILHAREWVTAHTGNGHKRRAVVHA